MNTVNQSPKIIDCNFSVFSSELENEDTSYIAYGLKAIDHINSVCLYINDISTNVHEVSNLCELCNKNQPAVIHLQDLIEDFLN